MTYPKIVTVGGSRPEVIKLSEVVKSLRNDYDHIFLYTGQHYAENMKDIFFDELDFQPDLDLRSNSSDTDVLKQRISKSLLEIKPTHVIAYGDTNSGLAGSIAAKEIPNCKIIHIEAGLRSFDMRMAEERNRIMMDQLSDYLFAPSELSKLFLKYENIEKNVVVTGNTIVDICKKFYDTAEYKSIDDIPNKFILLTAHRAENVDDPSILRKLMEYLKDVNYPIVFPVHPRTRKNLEVYNIKSPSNVIMIEPLSYLEFLGLLKRAMLVLTDSGGLQEECIILRKPCITLRNTTERWETLLLRANKLFPIYTNQVESLNDVIEDMLLIPITSNPYGQNVTEKVVNQIHSIVSQK